MGSNATFHLIPSSALDGLVLAATPQVVTEGHLFFQRTYTVDRFDEFLDTEARALPASNDSGLAQSGFVLASVRLVLKQTHDLDLEALQHPSLAASLKGPGRQVLVFARHHARAVLKRWPESTPTTDDIWAVLAGHGFAESQRDYAHALAAALTTLRSWLEAVDWDHTGLLLVAYEE